jgi:predicted phosphohydrolase
MDIFGSGWSDHPAKMARNITNLVGEHDILLIPGDISWAMKRKDAEVDLEFLAKLPGTKILIKGNHDYWWPSDRRLEYEGLNDTPWTSADGQIGVAGTRGWDPVGESSTSEERANHDKHVAKEVARLSKRLSAINDCVHKFVMIHHPPLPDFAPLLRQYNVECVVYGHIHLGGGGGPLPESWMGLKCFCVAADRISFTPKLIAVLEQEAG